MTPADKRIADLLDRWLTSIELHLKYAKLDDASYRNIQSWPEHERPTRWILEVAQQKVLQLKSLAHLHAVQQDSSFAEALELMCFLANLVGAQNIQRFVPLADPDRQNTANETTNSTIAEATLQTTESAMHAAAPTPKSPDKNDDSTREIPQSRTTADATDSTRQMPQLQIPSKRDASPRSHNNTKRSTAKTAGSKATLPAEVGVSIHQVVIADAIRLLKWGREWHELPDLIARMAERPGASEVRRIIKTQRSTIEQQMAN